MKANPAQEKSILKTVDEFIAAVPWDDWRKVLVYRRQHGGRTYVRIRTWNKHQYKGVWYPTRRYFVIPIDNAKALSEAILSAIDGPKRPKPNWLKSYETAEKKRPDRKIFRGMMLSELKKKRLEALQYLRTLT